MPSQFSRNEARQRRVQMPVAVLRLLGDVEALRHHQVQVGPRARHRHVQQPALFFDFALLPGGQVGRHAAVDHVEQEHGLPFLPLGRMDGGQDQVVLVALRRARFVAGGLGRVECELGQETFARAIAAGHLRELGEVTPADCGVVVQSLQVRPVPVIDGTQVLMPRRRVAFEVIQQRDQFGPGVCRGGRRFEGAHRAGRTTR